MIVPYSKNTVESEIIAGAAKVNAKDLWMGDKRVLLTFYNDYAQVTNRKN